jgi:O-antigen ligase
MSFWKRIFSLSIAMKAAVAFAACYVLTTGYHLNEFQALPGQLKEFLTTGNVTTDPFQGDIGRFAMWMTATSKILQSWNLAIFGYGPGSYWGRSYPIHGEYFSVLFQYGFVGLFIVLGYMVHTWKFLLKRKELILFATSFLIINLDCVGNFPMQIASTGFMILIVLGLIERERLKNG